MMVSSMRYFKNNNMWRGLLLGLALLLFVPAMARAEGIAVRKAEIRLTDKGYQLNANFDIKLGIMVEQALTHGITLNFVSEFSLTRSRWYWLDEVADRTEQTTKLSYSALTRQYRIKRENLFQNFATLEDALRVLGNQSSNPVPLVLINKNSGYIASMFSTKPDYTAYARMRLDISQLPKPLQVNALTSDEWRLDSDGYSWKLTAEEIDLAEKVAR